MSLASLFFFPSLTESHSKDGLLLTPTRIADIFPVSKVKLATLKVVEGTSLEWTEVINGFFIDYLVAPKVPSYQPPMAVIVDIPNNVAAIPGSGDVPVAFTHTWDIAKFVAALVDSPKKCKYLSQWPFFKHPLTLSFTGERESYVIGSRVTLKELVQLAEEAKGVKFTVTHDDLDTLRDGRITELPGHVAFYPFMPKPVLQRFFASFGILMDKGVFDLRPERTLNDEFPDIKARGVKELFLEAWKE